MMTQWQFLIQKEGDQDWLPLEAPNVEILEGRYNLMAQVHVPGAEVEVQIRHEYELDGLFQDVVQRRRQHSDFDGYLDLIPITYLPPGLWEVQCQLIEETGKPMNFSPQHLKLQVLAQDFEILSDWDMSDALPSDRSVTFTQDPKEAIASTTPAIAPPKTSAPVILPPNLKDIPQVPLCLSDKFRLPPLIYRPEPEEVQSLCPQLPEFLSSAARQLTETCAAESTEPHLAFLRCVAQRTDRQQVYAAFAPLAQRQQFFKTLNALAAAIPTSNTEPQKAISID